MTNDQNTIANNAQTENIVKKMLTSEVRYAIGIALFLAGVVAPFYSVKQDVALIKQNHYYHIEQLTKEMTEMKERQTKAEENFVKIMEEIARVKYSK